MGDAVELSFDGGWWDMEVSAVAEAAEATAQWDAMGAEAAAAEGAAEGARRYSLSSTRFVGAEHTVHIYPLLLYIDSAVRGSCSLVITPQGGRRAAAAAARVGPHHARVGRRVAAGTHLYTIHIESWHSPCP